jgi:hypothetical protein
MRGYFHLGAQWLRAVLQFFRSFWKAIQPTRNTCDFIREKLKFRTKTSDRMKYVVAMLAYVCHDGKNSRNACNNAYYLHLCISRRGMVNQAIALVKESPGFI